MSELVRQDLGTRMAYAKAIAEASLLPSAYRKAPANILLAMEYGDALGLSPIAAIQGIHVVDGKPTASAQLIGALVRRAGHRLRVEISPDGQTAKATVIRSDDPDFIFASVWDMDRANAAGLAGKGVWRQYPTNMLKARAITEVARDACPEVLSGVAYTAEELGAEDHLPDLPPMPITVELVSHDEPDGPDAIVDAEIIDMDTPEGRNEALALVRSAVEHPSYSAPGPLGREQRSALATAEQLKMIRSRMAKDHNCIDDADCMELINDLLIDSGLAAVTGSLDSLTKRQASTVIDAIKGAKAVIA
jgi:hypothetical protein